MTADIIDMQDWKYTKVAVEFVRLRRKDPTQAAIYARSQVKPAQFSILTKYIEMELHRNGEYEPHEE